MKKKILLILTVVLTGCNALQYEPTKESCYDRWMYGEISDVALDACLVHVRSTQSQKEKMNQKIKDVFQLSETLFLAANPAVVGVKMLKGYVQSAINGDPKNLLELMADVANPR